MARGSDIDWLESEVDEAQFSSNLSTRSVFLPSVDKSRDFNSALSFATVSFFQSVLTCRVLRKHNILLDSHLYDLPFYTLLYNLYFLKLLVIKKQFVF